MPGKAPPGSWWVVTQSLYGQLRQDAVLLTPGEKSAGAAALLAYLKSPPALEVIRAFGYERCPRPTGPRSA